MKNLILASKSPRRRQLLKDAGFEFVIKTKEIEETYPSELHPEKVPEYLAIKKADAVKEFIQKDEIILTSDTIVIKEGIIYEKPKDYDEAFRMLSELSNNMHIVITGVCLRSKHREVVFSEKTEVYFNEITPDEIRFYLDNFKPFDKAGSYGIQDWFGLNKVKMVNGCFYNVVGLPVSRVFTELAKF